MATEHPQLRSAGQDIHGLRTLIRRHLLDRDAIKAGRVRFIYFVDAHELKAYIHGVSSAYIEGFELGPERTIRASGDRSELLMDLRLKCEEAIRWLLFSQPDPVVVLPPHGVEIEEEIAYQRQRDPKISKWPHLLAAVESFEVVDALTPTVLRQSR